VNTDEPSPAGFADEERVLSIQTKLHRWAADAPTCRFDDLFNLICDPAVLTVAWHRVSTNRGARSAGVDGETVRSIEQGRGAAALLDDLRVDLRARRFEPMPVRERMIPKPGTMKRRRLGIPTVRDRVVQSALKLVLEPIFEADFKPCSYGFRPGRRAQDAIAEIHLFCTSRYEWIVEGDIAACFDEIDHVALMGRIRRRIGDKRVLLLVKAFLKAGILSEDATERHTVMGTPQGGILSPLLANIALSALDGHFAAAWQAMGVFNWQRQKRHGKGLATYRLVRYADDFVILVFGTQAQAEGLRHETAAVLSSIGLRLSEEKTRIVHIDEGFDFLGFRIRRDTRRGTEKRFIYTYPSKKALASIKARVRAISKQGRNQPLSKLLRQLNLVLRGWTNYHRHGVSKATFGYLRHFTWLRVVRWLRRKHPRANWTYLRRRYSPGGWPSDGGVDLFNPQAVAITRYRYRGSSIPTPWSGDTDGLLLRPSA
jgi:RNA-directed DNA polymerase